MQNIAMAAVGDHCVPNLVLRKVHFTMIKHLSLPSMPMNGYLLSLDFDWVWARSPAWLQFLATRNIILYYIEDEIYNADNTGRRVSSQIVIGARGVIGCKVIVSSLRTFVVHLQTLLHSNFDNGSKMEIIAFGNWLEYVSWEYESYIMGFHVIAYSASEFGYTI